MSTQCFHTDFEERKGICTWKISGFTTKCLKKNGESILSPKFHMTGDETDWYLELYPKGCKQYAEWISLFLYSHKRDVYIRSEIALINASGQKVNEKVGSGKFNHSHGYFDFITARDLLDPNLGLLPNDELTVSCIVTEMIERTDEPETRLRHVVSSSSDSSVSSSLSEDWAKLFDLKQNTDVLLKVGTETFTAHKIVLMCRSPVFASMFEHDMLEKDTNEVVISDISMEVLASLVRFMYTDAMSPPPDTQFAMKLLVAADKYDLRTLKVRCEDYIYSRVSASNVFSVLKVANACNAMKLVARCMCVIEHEMASVTALSDWISKLKANPEVLGVVEKYLNESTKTLIQKQ